MQINVNNQPQNTTQSTLNGLLTEIGMQNKKGIAVALNNKVVAKANWQNQTLTQGDNITIITATQGG